MAGEKGAQVAALEPALWRRAGSCCSKATPPAASSPPRSGPKAARGAPAYAQKRAERMRADLLRSDRWRAKTLAFSGRPE